jgi:hypothetical protein
VFSLVIALCTPPFAALVWWISIPAPTDQDIAALKLQGEALMAATEQYAGQHDGVYPATLQEAHIKPPKTRWGRWHYHVTREDKISVSVGHYLRDGFTLSWQPGHGWYLDT